MNQDEANRLFNYNPDTGVLTNKIDRNNGQFKAGDISGYMMNNGYRCVWNKKCYGVHSIAWLITYGELPKSIDHINHNKLDNRISNLRVVSHTDNMRNRTSKKGIFGVFFYKRDSNFVVKIGSKHVGYFETFFDACCARKSAEITNNYHINHGGCSH